MIKFNLGCGLQCPQSWTNIDSSFGAKISKYPLIKKILFIILPKSILPNMNWPSNTTWMDLTKPFKYKSESVDCIFSSHTFEHFTYNEASFVFSECYRVLKKDGVIRIIVPDFEILVNRYLQLKVEDPKSAAFVFTNDSGYFEIPVPNTFFELLKFFFQRKNNHHFLYDEPALKNQLEKAGFINVTKKKYGDSLISEIKTIENESRFSNALCLEAVKA